MARPTVVPGRICPKCFDIIEAPDIECCPKDGERLRSLTCDLQPGSLVDGKFEIIEEISSGGFGSVYRAVQHPIKRIVAVKVLHGHMQKPDLLKRFRREAMASSAVKHPAFPVLYSFGVLDSGQPYLVMDYIDGTTIDSYVAKNGPLSPSVAASVFVEICDALAAAHHAGIIHRDIKPSNIMLVEGLHGRLRPMLLDLGLAQLVDTGSASLHLTKSGETVGTPAYMSPEQCLGHQLDGRSDLYSLACVMYECLTGKPPFEGFSMFELMHQHVNEIAPRLVLSKCPAKLQSCLSQAIAVALSKDPKDRFQTADEMREHLATVTTNKAFNKRLAAQTSIKLPSAKLLIPVGITAGIAAAVVYAMVPVISVLNTPPKLMISSTPWQFSTVQTEAEPVDFAERLRKGKFLLSARAETYGEMSDEATEGRKTLAAFLGKYGHFSDAVKYLQPTVAHLSQKDSTAQVVADLTDTLAAYEVALEHWPLASRFYHQAIQRHRNVADPILSNVADDLYRLAAINIRLGYLDAAEENCKQAVQVDDATNAEHAVHACLEGDIDLIGASRAANDNIKKQRIVSAKAHYDQARAIIQRVKQIDWAPDDYDAKLTLREGDLAMLSGDYKGAVAKYKDVAATNSSLAKLPILQSAIKQASTFATFALLPKKPVAPFEPVPSTSKQLYDQAKELVTFEGLQDRNNLEAIARLDSEALRRNAIDHAIDDAGCRPQLYCDIGTAFTNLKLYMQARIMLQNGITESLKAGLYDRELIVDCEVYHQACQGANDPAGCIPLLESVLKQWNSKDVPATILKWHLLNAYAETPTPQNLTKAKAMLPSFQQELKVLDDPEAPAIQQILAEWLKAHPNFI